MYRAAKPAIKLGIQIILAMLLVAALALAVVSSARAAETVTGGPEAIIPAETVLDDDLFISGEKVIVDGTVTGDLFASGVEVTLNGTVEGNVFIGGELLALNGHVGGNVFSGGCALSLGSEAVIERNLYAGGFSLIADSGSRVGRTLYAAAFQTSLKGEIGRNVEVATGALELSGTVGGDTHVELGETCPYCLEFVPVVAIQPGLRIGETASIGGDLSYEVTAADYTQVNESEIIIATPAIALNEADLRAAFFEIVVTNMVRRSIGEFVSLLIVGSLLLYFLPERVTIVVDRIKARPLPSLGWGLLIVVLFPLALILAVVLLVLFTTIFNVVTLGQMTGLVLGIGGIGIGSVVTGFLIVFSLITKVVFAYWVGNSLLARFTPATLEGRWGSVWSLVVGAFLYELVRTIPVFGWLVALAVILIGVGAIFNLWRETYRPVTAIA